MLVCNAMPKPHGFTSKLSVSFICGVRDEQSYPSSESSAMKRISSEDIELLQLRLHMRHVRA